ncbi:hypothetical protein [Puniceibacterium confluentis]|uniref:hypothetical protein n=1 Tax=Puniceibacterium confluentis TaxID=1958944 RepID=UPI003567EBEC
MRQIFSAKAALDGGSVRRSLHDIERVIGLENFLYELDRRGYSAVANAGQVVIFCNREPVRPLVGPEGQRQKFSENFCQDFSEKSWSGGTGFPRTHQTGHSQVTPTPGKSCRYCRQAPR